MLDIRSHPQKNFQDFSFSIDKSFCDHIDAFCQSFAELGFNIKGYNNGDVHKFKRLSLSQKISTLRNLKKYISMYSSTLEERIEPENEAQLLWYALAQWKLTPTSDIFTKIKETDYIEVYNTDNLQIHRSFNYFQLSSYSVEDILVYPWTDLYERDPSPHFCDYQGKLSV